MIEFALALPILLLTFLGLFDLGRAAYYYNSLSNLAREGARAGVIIQDQTLWRTSGNSAGTYSGIASYSGTGTIVGSVAAKAVMFDLSRTTVTIQAPFGTWRSQASPLTVRVQYPFQPHFAGWIGLGPTINLQSQSTMRIQ